MGPNQDLSVGVERVYATEEKETFTLFWDSCLLFTSILENLLPWFDKHRSFQIHLCFNVVRLIAQFFNFSFNRESVFVAGLDKSLSSIYLFLYPALFFFPLLFLSMYFCLFRLNNTSSQVDWFNSQSHYLSPLHTRLVCLLAASQDQARK